mgnify:CR=1 FL=1
MLQKKVNKNQNSLSPHTVAMAMIGGAHIHIDYSSPSVRNRIIFGGLLAFNEVWQSGAHNATWIESDYDLIINASSGGMIGKPPLNRNIIKLADEAKGVIDIVYNPEMTSLLNRAKRNNMPFVGGLTMLIEQAKPSFEKWSKSKIKVDDKIYQLARNKLK